MTVVPAFVGVGRDLFAPGIGASVHAFVEFKNFRIVFCKALHSYLHGLVGVVLFELQNSFVSVRPREDVVDVIFRPNALW